MSCQALRKGDVGPKVNEVKDMPPVLRGVLYGAEEEKGVDASNIRRGYLEKMCDFSIASGSGGDVVLAERASEPLEGLHGRRFRDCRASEIEHAKKPNRSLEAVSRMIRHVPRRALRKSPRKRLRKSFCLW